MIPKDVEKAFRVVKNGVGGPEDNAIPVREDIQGANIGWLKNGDVVIVPVSGFRKTLGSDTWVLFERDPDFLGDNWTMENSHLYPVPAPEPKPTEDAVWQEVLFYTHPSVEKRVMKAMEWKAAHPPAKPAGQ